MTRSLLDDACATCRHHPFDVGPGCPCHHAPCIHDHNVTVAANAETRTVAAIAAWLEVWANDEDNCALAAEDRSLLRDAADEVRSGAWRKR